MTLSEFQSLCLWFGFLVCVGTYGWLAIDRYLRRSWLRTVCTTLLIVVLLRGVAFASELYLIRPDLDCDSIPWWIRLIEPACW